MGILLIMYIGGLGLLIIYGYTINNDIGRISKWHGNISVMKIVQTMSNYWITVMELCEQISGGRVNIGRYTLILCPS